jgi:hypothetical protein
MAKLLGGKKKVMGIASGEKILQLTGLASGEESRRR